LPLVRKFSQWPLAWPGWPCSAASLTLWFLPGRLSAIRKGPQWSFTKRRRPPGSLTGELIVRVWSTDGHKRGLKPGEPSGLPLLPGEKVRVEARLSQPAYAYLLWVDGQGNANLIYPRDDGKYGTRPSGGTAQQTVRSPEALDEGHRMKGPGGLETVLLLVRRQPLPSGTDLAGLISPLPNSPLRAGQVFATRGLDEGQPIEALRAGPLRGIDDEADKIDDPLLQLMEKLRTKNQFEVIKAAQFAYRGE
jgi:hypothetical protein